MFEHECWAKKNKLEKWKARTNFKNGLILFSRIKYYLETQLGKIIILNLFSVMLLCDNVMHWQIQKV